MTTKKHICASELLLADAKSVNESLRSALQSAELENSKLRTDLGVTQSRMSVAIKYREDTVAALEKAQWEVADMTARLKGTKQIEESLVRERSLVSKLLDVISSQALTLSRLSAASMGGYDKP